MNVENENDGKIFIKKYFWSIYIKTPNNLITNQYLIEMTKCCQFH